jgi:hypothetical protein
MIVALDLNISTLPTGSTTSYNTASLLLGNLIRKTTDGDTDYIRPMKITPNRVFDYYGVDFRYVDCFPYSDDVDYLVSVYNSAATQTTLTVKLAKFDKRTEEWTNCGRLFILAPTGSAATRNATAVHAKLYRYSTGTVEVNGISVTGSGTAWETNRIFQGSRIGFGTTSSAAVTTWYEIATVPTNTNFELQNNTTNFAPGTPYVIEELKISVPNTYGTNAALNGIALIQGVHEGTFSFSGTTILPAGGPAGTGSYIDRTRSFVRLAESRDTLLLRSPGPAIFNRSINTTSSINDYLYVFNQPGGNNIQIARFNLGTPITNVQTGSSFTQFEFITATGSGALVTAPSRFAFFAKPSHGPGSGSNDIYFVSSARLNRTKLSEIYSGSTSIVTDNWFEIPPMGPGNYAVFNSVNQCYVPMLDKFFLVGAQAIPYNSCAIYDYNVYGKEIERRVLLNSNVVNSTTSRPYKNFIYTTHGSAPFSETSNGMLYLTIGTANTQNIWLNIPIGADYKYAPQTKQWAVFPKLIVPSNKKFKSSLIKYSNAMSSEEMSFPPERVYIFYRTSGIDDDSGSWTRLPDNGDMSNITATEQIQLAVAWDVMGTFALYPPVYGVTLVYENDSQISQYIPSLSLTDVTNKRFVWRQAQLFITTNIPVLNIKLYNSETGNLITEDTTALQSHGVFQYSANSGSTWNTWDNNQNVLNNYIRYTANNLPANTLINAVITEQ